MTEPASTSPVHPSYEMSWDPGRQVYEARVTSGPGAGITWADQAPEHAMGGLVEQVRLHLAGVRDPKPADWMTADGAVCVAHLRWGPCRAPGHYGHRGDAPYSTDPAVIAALERHRATGLSVDQVLLDLYLARVADRGVEPRSDDLADDDWVITVRRDPDPAWDEEGRAAWVAAATTHTGTRVVEHAETAHDAVEAVTTRLAALAPLTPETRAALLDAGYDEGVVTAWEDHAHISTRNDPRLVLDHLAAFEAAGIPPGAASQWIGLDLERHPDVVAHLRGAGISIDAARRYHAAWTTLRATDPVAYDALYEYDWWEAALSGIPPERDALIGWARTAEPPTLTIGLPVRWDGSEPEDSP